MSVYKSTSNLKIPVHGTTPSFRQFSINQDIETVVLGLKAKIIIAYRQLEFHGLELMFQKKKKVSYTFGRKCFKKEHLYRCD